MAEAVPKRFGAISATFAKKLAARGESGRIKISPDPKMVTVDFALLDESFPTVCVVYRCDVTLALCAKA